MENQNQYSQPQQPVRYHSRDKTTAGLLALFLGGIGVHRFYLGQIALGFLYLLFCWTFIPAIVGFIDAICFFSTSLFAFDRQYNFRP